MLKIIKWL